MKKKQIWKGGVSKLGFKYSTKPRMSQGSIEFGDERGRWELEGWG